MDCVSVVWAGACEQALLLLLAQGRCGEPGVSAG